MGLSVLRIADPQRRDRLLLLNAFAIVLLTLLGAAGESLGMDRHLKVNTAKHRTHSLFRQGCMLYELIPNMPDARLRPLAARFHENLNQHEAFNQTFAIVLKMSDCLSCQAFCHFNLVRMIAFKMVKSCRMQATMASFFGFPFFRSLSGSVANFSWRMPRV
jgi:hypothetical protein